MTVYKHKEWTLSFRRNVHMYCHDLRASDGQAILQVPCEDSAVGTGLVLIWPYELQMESSAYSSLIQALHAWAKNEGLSYRIQVSMDTFEPNDGS